MEQPPTSSAVMRAMAGFNRDQLDGTIEVLAALLKAVAGDLDAGGNEECDDQADDSPPEARSEAIERFPLPDDLGTANSLSESPEAFDPPKWLAAFEAEGGGWVLRDHLSRMWQIDGGSAYGQRRAARMLAELGPANRIAIAAHLRSLQSGEACHG